MSMFFESPFGSGYGYGGDPFGGSYGYNRARSRRAREAAEREAYRRALAAEEARRREAMERARMEEMLRREAMERARREEILRLRAEHERMERLREEKAEEVRRMMLQEQQRRRDLEEEEARRNARMNPRNRSRRKNDKETKSAIVRGRDGSLYRVYYGDDPTSETKTVERTVPISREESSATGSDSDERFSSCVSGSRSDDEMSTEPAEAPTSTIKRRSPSPVSVEDVPDDEDEELRELHSVWRNRRPAKGQWIEPVFQ